MKGKDEAAALVAALQSTSDSEARASACESVLLLTKADATCAVLCSVGGIHAVVSAVKGTGESGSFLRSAAQALSNLYRFDQKLVSVVVRLQGGIGGLLEALREYIHCGEPALLQALLVALSDVSNNAANAAQLVKEGGTAVVLASVLAHLKSARPDPSPTPGPNPNSLTLTLTLTLALALAVALALTRYSRT